MKKGKSVVIAAAFVLALGLQTQAHGAAMFVEAADDAGAASEIVPLAVTGSVDVTYVAGWNLVSLPVTPPDATFNTLFSDAISAFAFDNGYQSVTTLTPCEGYWLNLTTGGTYTVNGTPVMDCTTTRPASWSLMGIPYGGTTRAAITGESNIISIFGFNNGYFSATDLMAGGGYWVNMTVQADLTLTGTAGKPIVDLRRDVELTGSTLTAIAGDAQQTLQLGVAAESLVEMPPLPPSGALDARVQVAGVATQGVPAQPLDYRVSLQGDDLELQWNVEAVDNNRWQLVVDGVTHSLNGVGSLNLNQTADVWLRYLPATPTQFALHANYPNPFNPSTTIRYDLAEAAQVQLVVYDMLGQQIRDLVAMQQPAGAYTVVWDGRNDGGQQVANGVYFYEIKAGDFRGIRKMMLTK